MTLRLGDLLVGVRADTDHTFRRLRTLLAAWTDDTHADVPWAFDVLLDPVSDHGSDPASGRRAVRPVPQLRAGQLLMARSRHEDDVLWALALVLGGVLARQDRTRTWSGLRTFVASDDDRNPTSPIVLSDARPPTLSAGLTRHGVTELATWSVALDGPGGPDSRVTTVHVPPPLGSLDWAGLGVTPPPATWRAGELVGLVGLERHHHDATTAGAAFSRFAARHPSADWFTAVERLARDRRVIVTADPAVARDAVVGLLHR